MKIDAHLLPDDLEQLKRMVLELQQVVAEKDAQIHELLQAYNAKLAKEYAKKSEKMPGAGELFNEVEDILDEHDKALLATSPLVKKEKAKPKRRPLPAQLPRVEVVVDLDEDEKVCDCCQSPLHKIGESSSETLEFVPAHIKVIKTIRPKYTCRHCEREGIESVVKTAKMPATAIPKSIATPSLLSQIIMCKYQFGLPLYRQETLFSDIGIELSRQTMSSWMLRCAELLSPLYQRLREILLSQAVIHGDETSLNVINAEKATSYMWLYCCGDDKPGKGTNIVLFDYHNSRAAHCVVDFLDGYQGYMHVDGYKAYEQTKATLVACLAHIRRKFIEAKGNNKKTVKADVALNLIRKLYGIEQAIKGKSVSEKFTVRQQKAKPIVDELYQWLLKHKDKIPPQMALG
ncbi:IS66 family transposase, partial [Pseudoalteromonas sp. Ld20]|uniref:IS66 family transposase n=1 Tax=Pseudoalteromonas sp. Ld20 TaxID=649165 RepID=UPI003863EA54